MIKRAVIISIHSKWCKEIFFGEKTIPMHCDFPLRACVYMTKQGSEGGHIIGYMNISGFVNTKNIISDDIKNSLLSREELEKYKNKSNSLSYWNISSTHLYGYEKNLIDFSLKKAPQS